MQSERRYCVRHQADLEVYIRYGKRRFLGARALDLSENGMFLAVQALTLPIGTPVELELQGLGKSWLIPALVSHRRNNGIGVTFREPQVALFQETSQQPAESTLPIAAGGIVASSAREMHSTR